MQIIKQGFEIIDEPDMLKKLELCGRVCYKSEDRITENSAKGFVERIIDSGHKSVLEHVNISFNIRNVLPQRSSELLAIIDRLRAIQCSCNSQGGVFITMNLRSLRDLFLLGLERNSISDEIVCSSFPYRKEILRGVRAPLVTSDKSKYVEDNDLFNFEFYTNCIDREKHIFKTVKFITDRGVSHELVRHRRASYLQESTRYCNYSKKGLTFIEPVGFELTEDNKKVLLQSELAYNRRVNEDGLKPEQARYFLPNGLKTEIICTANICQWKYMLKLRTSKYAHPQIADLFRKAEEAILDE